MKRRKIMNNTHANKHMCQAIFACLIAGLFLIPTSATIISEKQKEMKTTMDSGGETIYVDDDNTAGPWDGTLEHPYQFIMDGITYASIGDTVYVFSGIYDEHVDVFISIALVGENKDTTIIDAGGSGTAVRITADDVALSGFTITHGGSNLNDAGVTVHTMNSIITENNIQQNMYFGLYVLGGNNAIYHNNILDNTYQAFDVSTGNSWDNGYPSGGNYWSDYTGTDEDEDGIGEIPYPTGNGSADSYPLIHPYGSVVNENTEEIFLTIQDAICDPDTQNGHLIMVKNGEYWEHVTIYKSLLVQGEDRHETVIDGRDTGDVITICTCSVNLQGFLIQHSGPDEQNAGVIMNGKNCSLTHNIIVDNYQGIIVKHSAQDSMIAYNEILSNGWNGIILKSDCIGVSIFENTISDNFYAGIGISAASNNYIYHNNFKTNRYQAYDNANNVWDNGYPSGGNYWSDYNGSDANGDGIGDTPYTILDGINTDRYPLMEPYTNQDNIPPIVTILSPENGLYLRNHRMFSRLFRTHTIIIGDITVDVDASDAQSGIAKVEFYLESVNQPEFIDTQAPYSWTWTHATLLKHKHSIIVVAYDNAGNVNADIIKVRRFL
jgi:parallel beta-helix repeat protein